MSASVPDCDVHRSWCSGAGVSGDVSIAAASRKSAARGMRRLDCRRCMVAGKWPVWKEDFWIRRVPPRDFGSEGG
jgi:hypothetical protein